MENREDSTEKWIPLKGFEGLYEVSSLGRIKALEKIRRNGKKGTCLRVYKERIMKPSESRRYKIAALMIYGSKKYITVHRAVALSFIPNPKNLPCINHINGDRFDNRVSNLEWCTYKQNSIHYLKTRKVKPFIDPLNNKSLHQVCDLESGIFFDSKKEAYMSLFSNTTSYDMFIRKLKHNGKTKNRFHQWKKI